MWLSNHRSGWSRSIVTYAPKILITMTSENGKISVIEVWPNRISIYARFGNYGKKLTNQDYSEIISILGIVLSH